ncbi:MAG: right-handed parallel beta-helix repeat-containing protein [Armatimonadetes bacterium]|nr:right-handed parallel beta-helix repeat-containing protein [Armatimonadota bacterium]
MRRPEVVLYLLCAACIPAMAADLSGTISTPVTLPAGSHRLVGNLTVASSGTLTLQAGATLQPTGNYGISVYGSLVASGTAASRCVVGTSTKGYWQGMFVQSGGQLSMSQTTVSGAVTALTVNNGRGSLSDCQISYCSRDGIAAYGTAEVQVSSCQLSHCDRRGLFLETTSVTGSIGACDFANIGEYPIVAKATLVELLSGPFTFSSVALPYIGVSCSADEDILDADTWQWLGYDYDLRAGTSDELLIASGGALTVVPGVRVRGGSILVEGSLATVGSGAPVYFYGPAGDAGSAGDWPGITVAGGNLNLAGAVIRDATTAVTATTGTINLQSCSLLGARFDGLLVNGAARLVVTNCTISRCGRSGVRITASAATGQVRDSLISYSGDWPAYVMANAAGLLGPNLSFSSNAVPAIGVNCAISTDVTASQTWRRQPLPYNLAAEASGTVARIASGVTLTIEPGVCIVGGGLEVAGSLIASGSPDALIVFSSDEQPPVPGDWPGIVFRAGATGLLEWAVVEYATTGVTVDTCSPRIANSWLVRCAQDGLSVRGSNASPVIYNTELTANGRYGVLIETGAAPNLGNLGNTATDDNGLNTVTANLGPYDVCNRSALDVKAENNWWGTSQKAAIALRIYDSADASGVGTVDFEPFRTGPPNTPPQLRWLNTGAYSGTGVSPEVGSPSTNFVFKVVYSDAEGNPPAYVRVRVLSGGTEISGSPFALTAEAASPDYRAGAVFLRQLTLAAGRAYSYYFEARDWELPAIGEPTQPKAGPVVSTPPRLAWTGEPNFVSDGIDPDTGFAEDTVFQWRVKYTDPDGDSATGVFLHLSLDGQPVAGSPFQMKLVSGTPAQGQIFAFSTALTQASATGYQYRFTASDGVHAASGEPTTARTGPSVQYRPKLIFTGAVGYEQDCVEPQSGTPSTQFHFEATYLNLSGRAPSYVRLHVARDGVEIANSPFECSALDSQPVNSGRRYGVDLRLPAGRTYTHWFSASDGVITAYGPATTPRPGPLSDQRPTLNYPTDGTASGDGLEPNSGSAGGTLFNFRVVYADGDGDPPRYVALRLFRDGVEVPGSPWMMTPLVGGDYKKGKTYEITKRLTTLGSWEYRFAASDGYLDAAGQATAKVAGPSLTGEFEVPPPETPPYHGGGVYPTAGSANDTPFSFSVIYRHGSGKPPSYVRVYYTSDGRETTAAYLDMTAADNRPFSEGRTYTTTTKLGHGAWSYWFQASDGTTVVRTDRFEGPLIDTRPVLAWVGSGSYASDGVNPDSGIAGQTVFIFRVKYVDADGEAPQRAQVIVYTDTTLTRSVVYDMTAEAPGDVRAGVVYQGSTVLPYSASGLRYRFVFDDGHCPASGPPAQVVEGPAVSQAGPSQPVIYAARAIISRELATIECHVSRSDLHISGFVVNMAGREVATLSASLDPTTRRAVLVWPYVSRHGTRVPPGMYLAILRANAPTGEICQQVLQVLVRPR